MNWGLKQITPPAAEPLDRDRDVKPWLRVDTDDRSQDAVLDGLIRDARDYAQAHTGRQLLTATWQLVLDNFTGQTLPLRPGVQIANGVYGLSNWAWQAWQERGSPWVGFEGNTIRLAPPPVQAVLSVTYLDQAGNQQTLDPSKYLLDSARSVPRLMPAYQQVWPATLPVMAAVQVTFLAGYGPLGSAVPPSLVEAMKLYVSGRWEYRTQLPGGFLDAVDRLLDREWDGEYVS